MLLFKKTRFFARVTATYVKLISSTGTKVSASPKTGSVLIDTYLSPLRQTRSTSSKSSHIITLSNSNPLDLCAVATMKFALSSFERNELSFNRLTSLNIFSR